MPIYSFRNKNIHLKIGCYKFQKNVCVLTLVYIECTIKFRHRNVNLKPLKFLGKFI